MKWEPGQTGNAGGRPKDKPITDALRRKLAENDWKALNTLIGVWVAKALSGDMQAMTAILDRLEGKPIQQIESHNVNENHFVKAPEKASKDDWAQYLAHKTKASVAEKTDKKSHANGNGKSH